MRILSSFALLCFALLSFSAHAAVAYRCNYCTVSQMKGAAENGRKAGDVYVYNLANGSVNKYYVTREDVVPGRWTYVAEPIPVEQDVVDAIAVLGDFFHATGGTMKGNVTLHAGGDIGDLSAWDLFQGRNRQRVLDYANNSLNYTFGAHTWISLSMSAQVFGAFVTAGAITPAVHVDLIFNDGSSVDVVVGLFDINLDEGSIVDSHGNPIPFSPNDLDGRMWDYSGYGVGDPDYRRAISRFAFFGIPIQSGTWRWACGCITGSCNCRPF